MATIKAEFVDVVYVLKLNEAELRALYQGLSTLRGRYDSNDQYMTACEVDSVIAEMLQGIDKA